MTTYTAYLEKITPDKKLPGYELGSVQDYCYCMLQQGCVILELYEGHAAGSVWIRDEPNLKLNAVYTTTNPTKLQVCGVGCSSGKMFLNWGKLETIYYWSSLDSLRVPYTSKSLQVQPPTLPDMSFKPPCIKCISYIQDYQFDDILEIEHNIFYRHEFEVKHPTKLFFEYETRGSILLEYEVV